MKRHNHNYTGCKHDLEFCGHCDVVYCQSCGKEWGTKTININPFIGDTLPKPRPMPYERPFDHIYLAKGHSHES